MLSHLLMTTKYRGGQTKHGESLKGRETVEYRAWAAMKTRCTNRNEPSWPHYGGRGISVCERWSSSYPAFLLDMGRRPGAGYSLDRYPDPDGDYEPGNVRWATSSEQNSNYSRNRRVTLNGQTRIVSEWANLTGISSRTICARLDAGWSVESALTVAVGEAPQYHAGKDRKTHCSNGHEYTPENSGRDSAGWRFCRTCNRDRSKNYMRIKRAREKQP